MSQHYHMGSMCPACLEESGQTQGGLPTQSSFPKLKPGIYRVRMSTREGSEYSVEVEADSEADACGRAAFQNEGEARYAYFFHTVEVESV